MKILLQNTYIRIGVFILGFLLLHLGLRYFYFNHVAYKANKRYRLDEQFEKNADTLDHLFIGASRTNKAIATDSFPNAFKLYGPAESAPYHYYRAKYLLENHPYPIRQIIVPAELGVLAFNPQPLQFMGQYWKKYVDFRELAKYSDYPFYFYGLEAKIKMFPYHQRLGALLIMRDMKRDKVIWRYFKQPAWDQYNVYQQNIILAYLLERHLSIGDIVQPLGKTYFTKLNKLAIDYDIPLVFLKYPLRNEYSNNISALLPIARDWEKWKDSVVTKAPNTHLIDATHIYDHRPDYFMDPHHLNQKGKSEFSAWLRDTLTSLK